MPERPGSSESGGSERLAGPSSAAESRPHSHLPRTVSGRSGTKKLTMPRLPMPSRDALLHYARRARMTIRDAPPLDRIVRPGPGQESVWDFPRPPRVEHVVQRVRVEAFGRTIADTTRAIRIVETAGAPCYYLPPADCETALFVQTNEWSLCEWKGIAFAYDLVDRAAAIRNAAWSYPEPLTDLGTGYERIAGFFAFYAAKADACYVGDERVRPQGGGYYGGWVTSKLTGPIKGDADSGNW